MSIRYEPFRRRPTAGALVLVFAGLCAVSPIIGEPVLSGPGDVRLLLRSVQEASLPASSAVTQDVGTVCFEPADEAAARWLDSLRASSPSNALPVLVFEEPTTSDIVATNLESGGAARIEPEDDYDPMWVLDSLNGLDPDIRDRLIPFFDPSLVSVRFVLRPVAVRPVAVRLLPDSGPGTVRARRLRRVVLGGRRDGRGRVAPFLCPSSERTVSINAFGNTFEGSDCYSEWLTHNSGADFNSQGFASIKEYSWSTNSEMSRFLALHKPFVLKKRHVNALDGYYETQTDTGTALKTFYIDYVAPAARLHLINSNNLSTVTLPIDGEGYSFPNANSTLFSSLSPAWVPGTTFRAGDGGSSKAGAWGALIEEFFLNDDAFAEYEATGTVGRGRLFAPTYQFVVQRIDNPSAPDGFQCKTLAIRFSCRVEDLYDFNYEDSELASHAAALQIQRGNGTGGGHGIVFKDVFFIDHTYQNPFEMESGASIHSTGEEME